MNERDDPAAWRALGELYHRYLTGLLLALVTRHGTARTVEVVRRTFRRQHLELFLPGLQKLGLTDLPHAVACAQYHVLSNALGGVQVSWIPESDTRSWVRFHPPRWIFDGTAVCGIPTEVSRAMMWGWHAHNGVSLGNPRLGFVCTGQTTDGQPGLEGYYVEEADPLEPEDRLRFRPGERPPGPPAPLPLPQWDARRLAKVERNYCIAYVRSILPELCATLGPADAGVVGRIAGRQVAMQYHGAVMALLNPGPDGDPDAAPAGGVGFPARLARLLAAGGDEVSVQPDGPYHTVQSASWRLSGGLALPEEAFEAWNGLWEGLAAMEGLRLVVTDRLDQGDDAFRWSVRPRRL
ncbi:MAG: hypothetical protein ACKV2O_05190 [Acidimicrobiales bacterium]